MTVADDCGHAAYIATLEAQCEKALADLAWNMYKRTELEALLRDLKTAAWNFKMSIYGAGSIGATETVPMYLTRVTAHLRAMTPDLQFGPTHERLVAEIAKADAALLTEERT
jgi:hypothetical protein